MKLQELVGKTITKIEQGVWSEEDEFRIYSGDEIIARVLNDGTLFTPVGMYFEEYAEYAEKQDAARARILFGPSVTE